MTTLIYNIHEFEPIEFDDETLISKVLSELETKYENNFELYTNRGTKFNKRYPLSFYKDDTIFLHTKGEVTINIPIFKISFTYNYQANQSDKTIIENKIIDLFEDTDIFDYYANNTKFNQLFCRAINGRTITYHLNSDFLTCFVNINHIDNTIKKNKLVFLNKNLINTAKNDITVIKNMILDKCDINDSQKNMINITKINSVNVSVDDSETTINLKNINHITFTYKPSKYTIKITDNYYGCNDSSIKLKELIGNKIYSSNLARLMDNINSDELFALGYPSGLYFGSGKKDRERNKKHYENLKNAKEKMENALVSDLLKDETYLELIDTCQIFYKTLTGKTKTLNVDLDWKVYRIKRLIRKKDLLSIEEQRLIFSGIQLFDHDTLSYYKIYKESTIQLLLRLRGGGSSSRFVDVSRGLTQRQPGSKTDGVPHWRYYSSGLTLRGYCHNVNCRAELCRVLMNKGYTTFDLVYDLNDKKINTCPECNEYVKPTSFILSKCKYKITAEFANGTRKVLEGETKKGYLEPNVTSDDETAEYRRMTINVVPCFDTISPKYKLINDVNEIIECAYHNSMTCAICLSYIVSENVVMTSCKHVFCKGCLDTCLKNCGNSCPLCRQDVDMKYVVCKN